MQKAIEPYYKPESNFKNIILKKESGKFCHVYFHHLIHVFIEI